MKKLLIVSPVIFLLALPFLSGAADVSGTYATNFPLTEDPISEGGNWINGKTVGLDWKNVATIPGLAYGKGVPAGSYYDPTAISTGSWNPYQSATATVHSINQTSNDYQEVELRLRSAISAHSNTGYEINFSCRPSNASPYSEIVRWNGPLGNFTYLSQRKGSQYGVTEGDIVKATIVGNVINVYKNGVLINTATDNTYTTGNPGIGFYGQQSTDFGFTSFTATGLRPGSDNVAPSPPTNLRILPQ